MLARSLKIVILCFALMALSWLVVWLPVQPLLALLGGMMILLGTAWLIALEFVLFASFGLDPKVARPSVGQLIHAWWREVLSVLRLFVWHQALRPQAVPDNLGASTRGRRGVVMIHGFVSNRGLWVDWMRRLQHLGHAYVAVNLEPVFGSIDDYIPIIEEAVQRVTAASGMPPVLVCHSMGGLAARAWLRSRGGAERVARIVTIGTPHHGTALTKLAVISLGRNSAQMRPRNPWMRDLGQDEGVKTGVSARYASFICYYSNSDNIVFPATTACLEGADNRHIPGVAHVALVEDAQVMEETFRLIQAG